jgi:hypothetical protein
MREPTRPSSGPVEDMIIKERRGEKGGFSGLTRAGGIYNEGRGGWTKRGTCLSRRLFGNAFKKSDHLCENYHSAQKYRVLENSTCPQQKFVRRP